MIPQVKNRDVRTKLQNHRTTVLPALARTIQLGTVVLASAALLGCGGSQSSGRGAESAWSPDGQTVVYWSDHDGNREICSVAPDGSDLRNLTRHPREDANAVFSPDGTKIAYFSRPGEHGQIYVANADGSDPINLSDGKWGDYNPTWSPDGRRIAFQSNRDGDFEIYVMNVDGSGVRAMTDNEIHETNPAFAPDGKHLAFVSHHSDANQIHVMDLEQGTEWQVTRGPADRRNPKWSPDSKWIVYHIDELRDGIDFGTVMLMRAEGTEPRVLVEPDAYNFNPFFSPDGEWIAYATTRHGEIGLHKIRTDGSEDTLITSGFCHSTVEPGVGAEESSTEAVLGLGTGSFPFAARDGKVIDVHYHRPESFGAASPIVFVMPGGGRNGDSYRDSWIEKSEQYGVLVLSPSYSQELYPGPVNYNMAGMIRSDDIENLKEYELVANRALWIFSDFEAIFDRVVSELGSQQKSYDMFGHSAGGQVVHRHVLFGSSRKLSRALAANAGWYTAADLEVAFPYGLEGAPVTEGALREALSTQLVVFLGELDDENETRGHLRRTAETNLQGDSRLSRGHYFFETSKKLGVELGVENRWRLEIVEGVGHSYREMGAAAADFLYGSSPDGESN